MSPPIASPHRLLSSTPFLDPAPRPKNPEPDFSMEVDYKFALPAPSSPRHFESDEVEMTAFSATSNPKEHSKGLSAPKGFRIAIRNGVGTGHGAKIVAASMATTTSLKSRNLARLYRIIPRSLQTREEKKK